MHLGSTSFAVTGQYHVRMSVLHVTCASLKAVKQCYQSCFPLCPSPHHHFFPLCSVPGCHQDHGCPIRGRRWDLQVHHMEETQLFGPASPIHRWRPTASGPPPHNTSSNSSSSSRRYRTETGSECHKLHRSVEDADRTGLNRDTLRDVSMTTNAWL